MFHSNGEFSLCTLIACCLRFVTPDITGKKEPKVFVTVKTAILWNVCFYRPLWSRKKCIYHVHNIFQETLWTLAKVFFWHLSCSILREKIGQNLFFARNFAFFSQIFVFLTTSSVPKNWSYYFHSNCQNTLWTLTICFLTFVMFDNMGTNRPKSFLHLKICLFLPIFWVFNNL